MFIVELHPFEKYVYTPLNSKKPIHKILSTTHKYHFMSYGTRKTCGRFCVRKTNVNKTEWQLVILKPTVLRFGRNTFNIMYRKWFTLETCKVSSLPVHQIFLNYPFWSIIYLFFWRYLYTHHTHFYLASLLNYIFMLLYLPIGFSAYSNQ